MCSGSLELHPWCLHQLIISRIEMLVPVNSLTASNDDVPVCLHQATCSQPLTKLYR